MAPFSLFCSSGVTSSSIVCSNKALILSKGCRLKLAVRKAVAFPSNGRNLSSSSCISCNIFLPESSACYRLHRTQRTTPWSSIRASKISGADEQNKSDSKASDEKPKSGKKFSLRLGSGIRLIFSRIKIPPLQSVLDEHMSYWTKNPMKAIRVALVAIVLGVCLLLANLTSMPSPKLLPYSDFITSLQEGVVSDVLFEEGSRRILYNTVSDESGSSESEGGSELSSMVTKATLFGLAGGARRRSAPRWKFSTRKIENDESFLLSLMREKGTIYSSAPQSALVSVKNVLVMIVSLWIPLTPLMWLLHRQLSGGNSPKRKRRPTDQKVCFDDVEGVDAAKEELLEIVSCLHGSINYNRLGAKLPRGILLVGPPGTGKTLLARAVAGEACVPFFSVSASEFVEMFVGRGAARIRDLFNVARKCEPSIVFIDELDAVGGRRGRSFNDERDQTLNQLLTEMDGFETGSKVIVMAATNRPEALDPALCRPGRFSRKVLVGEPDIEGRKKILSVHLRGVPLDEDTQLICSLVATLTPGLVGADLANIVNEAALLAARKGRDAVAREDFMLAIERSRYGIDKNQLTPSAITKGLEKLFPWMPSRSRKEVLDQDGFPKIPGYQTLS